MSKSLAETPAQVTDLVRMPEVRADETPTTYLARIMEMLPEPPDDVVDKITAQILQAPTLEAENQVWDSTSSKNCIGRLYEFLSVHVLPSDQPDSRLPYYVVANAIDRETGEKTVVSSGSMSIVASLVKAQLMGRLPAVAEIMGPRRETKNKRMPLHLRWYVGSVLVSTPAADGEVIDQ